MRRLVLGLDGMARLREAAGGPALPAAAALACVAGADAVRLGLSEELPGVSERDLREVASVGAVLELRMAPIPSLVKAALEARPDRVVLASKIVRWRGGVGQFRTQAFVRGELVYEGDITGILV